jgi:hypothetical protein
LAPFFRLAAARAGLKRVARVAAIVDMAGFLAGGRPWERGERDRQPECNR